MIEVLKNDYITQTFGKLKTFSIASLAELDAFVGPNYGCMLRGTNTVAITINGVTIPAWTLWFFPNATTGDMVGFAAYPTASAFYVIGHTRDEWYANRIY